MKWITGALLAFLTGIFVSSCGPLEGGDPLDGPPGADGPSLYIRPNLEEGARGSIGADARYDRY